MKSTKLLTVILLLVTFSCQTNEDLTEVSISIDPSVVTGSIDKMVYGHFYEHIYHSANGGLWGDMIWNRSFEEYPVHFLPLKTSDEASIDLLVSSGG